ncbi:MAG: 2-oxoacid:acceptor oxidoreductase subunit alpha [Candidatus Sumerlaeaceae bacterium]
MVFKPERHTEKVERHTVADSQRSLTIRFEGDSGDGIISMGKFFARVAARLGYQVYTFSTFLAVVRGGQVTFQARISDEPLLSQGNEPDILVALNRQAVADNGPKVPPGAIVIHPPFGGRCEEIPAHAQVMEVDFKEIAESEAGTARSKNIAAAGALLGLLGLDLETAESAVEQLFASKGPDVVAANRNALRGGYEEGTKFQGLVAGRTFPPSDDIARLLLSGNEAVALGALTAGVRFFAGYPITPASEIMEWLAAQLPKVGGLMLQAEDEIASLAMCIGASYGGVKAMTATSGPGLSLMIELLGLAGMAELPVVVVDVQRAGPSTGMPTKEAQGDLVLAAYGSHGEIPRVVIAPQTVSDCFTQTIRAVNVAHKFQIPVIVLSSQSLSHRMQTIDPPDFEKLEIYEEKFWDPETGPRPFKRYPLTDDGMPVPRSIPGFAEGMYRCGGLEHNEFGDPDFAPLMRSRMVARRLKRMEAIARAFRGTTFKYDTGVETTLGLMSWGATAPVALETIRELENEGLRFRALLPHVLWPLPEVAIRSFLESGIRTVFIPELNATAQFAELLRAHFTKELLENKVKVISITKDDGLPFSPADIRAGIFTHLDRKVSQEVSQ